MVGVGKIAVEQNLILFRNVLPFQQGIYIHTLHRLEDPECLVA